MVNPGPGRPSKRPSREKFIELRREYSLRQLAKKLKVSEGTIMRWQREFKQTQ